MIMLIGIVIVIISIGATAMAFLLFLGDSITFYQLIGTGATGYLLSTVYFPIMKMIAGEIGSQLEEKFPS